MAEPKVRFKKDDGSSYPDIQQVPFGDVVKPFTEKTKTENEDVLLSCAINGVFLNTELFGHQRGASNKGYKKIRRNTLILSAQNLHLGNANVNQRFDHGIISPAYNTYDIVGCNPDYMAQWVKRDATKKFFYDATTTGASQCRRNVDWNALYEQIFYVPCEEEQQKIADFLSSVDDVIVASEQEVANLETQKKAVMKKIFSQEVRFKRADGSDFPEWEKQTLGNLAEFSKGQGYTKSDLSETGSPIILYGRLYTKYQTVISKVDTFAEMKPRSVLSKKGDVIVPASGETAEDISVAAVVDVDGIILGGDLNIIHPCNAILPDYLAYALTFGTPHQEMAKRAQGKSIVHLHNDDLKSAVIVYPCLEEQHLIADFLSDFDEAIAAAKKELELWKELKKGLLQQLFV